MVDNVDQNLGRLLTFLDELGQLDNTIFVFTSDNGGSREGEADGTSSYFRTLMSGNAIDLEDLDADLERLDLIGGPRTLSHYPRGWAMASNTPFRLYKINTHAGGHSVPFILSWPDGLPAVVGDALHHPFRHQYAFVTDVLPTLCELTGVDPLTERQGRPVQAPTGSSLLGVLADPSAPSSHREQYLEMTGHRGYYRDGWEVVTRHRPRTPFGDHEWELYDLASDRTEIRDLAAAQPERVRELAGAWEAAALANQVYPLDEGSGLRYLTRPPYEDPYRAPVRLLRGTHTLERYRSQLLIQWRSFTVDVELRYRSGDHGILVAHGDQGGGYAFYVDVNGELVYVHNGYGTMTELRAAPVPDGCDAIRLSVTAPGGWQWDVALMVDGTTSALDRGTGHAERHGTVRGDRRRDRPPVARVMGGVRASRALRLHRRADRRHVHARRAGARRRPPLHRARAGDRRPLRVTLVTRPAPNW